MIIKLLNTTEPENSSDRPEIVCGIYPKTMKNDKNRLPDRSNSYRQGGGDRSQRRGKWYKTRLNFLDFFKNRTVNRLNVGPSSVPLKQTIVV